MYPHSGPAPNGPTPNGPIPNQTKNYIPKTNGPVPDILGQKDNSDKTEKIKKTKKNKIAPSQIQYAPSNALNQNPYNSRNTANDPSLQMQPAYTDPFGNPL